MKFNIIGLLLAGVNADEASEAQEAAAQAIEDFYQLTNETFKERFGYDEKTTEE